MIISISVWQEENEVMCIMVQPSTWHRVAPNECHPLSGLVRCSPVLFCSVNSGSGVQQVVCNLGLGG